MNPFTERVIDYLKLLHAILSEPEFQRQIDMDVPIAAVEKDLKHLLDTIDEIQKEKSPQIIRMDVTLRVLLRGLKYPIRRILKSY